MHITIDLAFRELSEIELRAHEAIIERLIYAHLAKEHLLCLAPADVLLLRRSIQFGVQARRALDIIARRQQDYMASLRSAPFYLVLTPLGSDRGRPSIGRQVFAHPDEINTWLNQKPKMFVENAVNDGGLLKFFLGELVVRLGSARDLIHIEVENGGGGALGLLIDEKVNARSVGMCFCDRDTNCVVPPFRQGSTGDSAHRALISRSMLPPNGHLIPTHPFFSFIYTEGWSIENLIGPYVAELFFSHAPECAQSRQAIIKAFPNFPNLSEFEFAEWCLINLKDPQQNALRVQEGAHRLPGAVAISNTRAADLARLTLPSSIIEFVRNYSRVGRYTNHLKRAFASDLKLASYSASMDALAKGGLVAFAADNSVNFA